MVRNALSFAGRTLLIATFALATATFAVQSVHAAETGEEHNTANAETLVPSAAVMSWYGPMLYGVAGLFIAAIVVGIARDSAGVKDPGIAAGEHDQAHAHHDDHGHDDHSHGHDDHGHGDHGHKH